MCTRYLSSGHIARGRGLSMPLLEDIRGLLDDYDVPGVEIRSVTERLVADQIGAGMQRHVDVDIWLSVVDMTAFRFEGQSDPRIEAVAWATAILCRGVTVMAHVGAGSSYGIASDIPRRAGLEYLARFLDSHAQGPMSVEAVGALLEAYGISGVEVLSVQVYGNVLTVRVRSGAWNPDLNTELGLGSRGWDPRQFAVAWAIRLAHMSYEVSVTEEEWDDIPYEDEVLLSEEDALEDGLSFLGRFLRRRYRLEEPEAPEPLEEEDDLEAYLGGPNRPREWNLSTGRRYEGVGVDVDWRAMEQALLNRLALPSDQPVVLSEPASVWDVLSEEESLDALDQ